MKKTKISSIGSKCTIKTSCNILAVIRLEYKAAFGAWSVVRGMLNDWNFVSVKQETERGKKYLITISRNKKRKKVGLGNENLEEKEEIRAFSLDQQQKDSA